MMKARNPQQDRHNPATKRSQLPRSQTTLSAQGNLNQEPADLFPMGGLVLLAFDVDVQEFAHFAVLFDAYGLRKFAV